MLLSFWNSRNVLTEINTISERTLLDEGLSLSYLDRRGENQVSKGQEERGEDKRAKEM